MNNDCGGVTRGGAALLPRPTNSAGNQSGPQSPTNEAASGATRRAELSAAGAAADCRISRAPIAPQRLAAPEVVALTASREDLPTNAGDDFGFFIALGIAIPSGALLWWLIAQAAKLL